MANIINISSYPDTLQNFIMIDGLTPDIIKRKYIWLLNAITENAIIGQDDYGLVWYSGTWIAGEWEDGTWYSGIWKDGEWKNGKFYSYKFDIPQLLLRNKRVIEKDNPIYSQFQHGIWRRGDFYNGYFGPEFFREDWNYYTYILIIFFDTRWESGTFYNGVFRNAAWMQPKPNPNPQLDTQNLKSKFINGIFYNSQWLDGTFLGGTFQGFKWWDGNFTGGDFVLGDWLNGSFNQVNSNIKSRFGSMPTSGSTDLSYNSVTWHNGDFISGEFHSGLNIISGMTAVSDNHNRTHWLDGTWFNGSWYGGTHVGGTFNNGNWYDGFWSDGIFNNGYWFNGFWLNGQINSGLFVQGIFKNLIFNGGQLGFQPPQYLIDQLNASKILVSPPKIISD